MSWVMRLPYGRSQGSFVAVGYSPCLTMRPRSSTSVLRPFSVSSLAAQPPLMPVPTTIASNEFVSMLSLIPSYNRRGIMDYLRVLQVPFSPTCLIMIAIMTVLMTFFGAVGIYGALGTLILQVWIFKYCYVLIEHLADGHAEPPVLDADMLSPFEIRPWIQVAIIVAAGALCYVIGGKRGIVL